MPAGYIDPETGVYLFGSDDPRQPMDQVLNLGQNATREAIRSDRIRLTNLEQIAPTPFPTPIAIAGAGITVDPASNCYVIGNLLMMSLMLRSTSGFSGSGGVTVARVALNGRPPVTITRNGVGSMGGAAATNHVMTITDTGDIRVWTTSSNQLLELATFWPRVAP